ncbi:hypothetical protein SAMN06297129_1293 [Pseudooceanicola antarcticus]|uniref:Transposase n=1 Tax=Pseudooceanicola antarcticus TaxID=1247613 RepID=A0A285ILJ3_9RHOB|nr:ISKra4 family transposase [Pseudooceanicola antarcticus]SNY47976.1 hypothetical protein SAMN06297129_1293 [Pseudooceanicola antarcticus]
MHWRITLEAVDPTGDQYRKEFMIENDLDGLADGKLGCSIEDGKAIMKEVQKIIVERQLDLWVRYCRVCPTCEGLLPIKDYSHRKILTVFGEIPVRVPRLMVCQKCNPACCFTFSPAADICKDRATPELLELSARLGAKFSYREASDVLARFLPDQSARTFTTLRNRTLALGKRIEEAERQQRWFEDLAYPDRKQLEFKLTGDPAREFVFNVDTAHIPMIKRYGGRTFEAVVGHCGRGGRGDPPGPIFAFEGTHPRDLKTMAALALKRQGYADQGEITVISDGAECLKRLAGMLPQPVTHILDWFHISMKVQPIAQLAATAPKHLSSFGGRIERIRWRLWNGQAGRALSLIARVRRDLSRDTVPSIWASRADKLLETLQVYIGRNRGSVVNYAGRYHEGKRVSTAPAEASVNRLVAKRFVKKQQMKWSRTGAHFLLKVRASVLNGDLPERTKYEAPKLPTPANIASFISPTPPLFRAA